MPHRTGPQPLSGHADSEPRIGGEERDYIEYAVGRWSEIKFWVFFGACLGAATMIVAFGLVYWSAIGGGCLTTAAIIYGFGVAFVYFAKQEHKERRAKQEKTLDTIKRQTRAEAHTELEDGIRARLERQGQQGDRTDHLISFESELAVVDLSTLPLASLTPKEIGAEIGRALPLQRRDKSKNYVGIKVRWRCRLENADRDSDSVASLDFIDETEYSEDKEKNIVELFNEHRPEIFATVDISKHPGIGLLRKRTVVFVTGVISSASEYVIHLNPAELEFQIAPVR